MPDGGGFSVGLAKVCNKVYKKLLCKKEQMCNWELRPLRSSQSHYASLDAYILVDLIEKLEEDYGSLNPDFAIEKHISQMDNRYV